MVPSMNPKCDVMVLLPIFILRLVPKRTTTGFRLRVPQPEPEVELYVQWALLRIRIWVHISATNKHIFTKLGV